MAPRVSCICMKAVPHLENDIRQTLMWMWGAVRLFISMSRTPMRRFPRPETRFPATARWEFSQKTTQTHSENNVIDGRSERPLTDTISPAASQRFYPLNHPSVGLGPTALLTWQRLFLFNPEWRFIPLCRYFGYFITFFFFFWVSEFLGFSKFFVLVFQYFLNTFYESFWVFHHFLR